MDETRFYIFVRAFFKLPEEFILSDHLGPGDVSGWDSLSWLELINALEAETQREFDIDQMASAKNLGNLKMLVVHR